MYTLSFRLPFSSPSGWANVTRTACKAFSSPRRWNVRGEQNCSHTVQQVGACFLDMAMRDHAKLGQLVTQKLRQCEQYIWCSCSCKV